MTTFRRYGLLAVLVPALLPPPAPFKLFVLLAGVARVRASSFALAVGVGRGVRYLAVGLVTVWYGDATLRYMRENAKPVALVVAGVVLACGVLFFLSSRRSSPTEDLV